MTPRRPLVPFCAALVLGTAAASYSLPLSIVIASGAAAGAAFTRILGSGAGMVPVLCIATALAAARGAALDLSPGRARPGAAARDADGGWARGRWRDCGADRALVAGAPLRVTRGLVRPGEAVLVQHAGQRVRAARGLAAADGPPQLLWTRPFVDDVVRLAPARRPSRSDSMPGAVASAFASLRARGLARVRHIHEPRTRELCAAVLFGERSGLDSETVELFTRTGARHALALSGLHVGLVALLVIGPLGSGLARALGVLLGRLSITIRPAQSVLRAGLVLALVPIAGGGTPVTRAAIAVAVGALAPLPALGGESGRLGALHAGFGDPGRRVDAPSLFALALGLEGLVQPDGLTRTGLLLSYCAAAGLLACAAPAARRLRCLFPNEGRVAATWSSGHARSTSWVVPLQRILDAARVSLAAGLVATLATLPLIWTRFGEWSPTGVLASPLVVLGLATVLCAGWAWTLLPGLVPESLPIAATRAWSAFLERLDALPGTPFVLPERPLLLLALGALAAILSLRSGGARSARVAALVFGAVLLPWNAGPRGLELVALDVGHGSAVVMRAPGAGVWLFDAGSRDRLGVARGAVAPLLRQWEARGLHVVASHADRDHVGALPWIVERWAPVLWAGALPAHLAVRLPHDTPRTDLDRGRMELRKGAGERLQVSLIRGGPWAGNEGSRSLLVAYRGQRALLSGDAEAEGLARMLESGELDGPFERVLMPHHGSLTRLLGVFLVRVEAEIAWTSGAGQPACAPALQASAVPLEWTARSGALRWVVEPRVELR